MKNSVVREHNGVSFHIRFSSPSAYKKSKTPMRALVTPLDEDGKPITKQQLFGTPSDYPVETPIRGKSRNDILQNLFPDAADHLITTMYEKGLLENSRQSGPVSDEDPDLAEIGQQHMDAFFARYKNTEKWCDSTVRKYKTCYKNVLDALQGIRPEQMTNDIYRSVQEGMFYHSTTSEDQKKRFSWKYGDAVSSTLQIQMRLLYLLVTDLQNEGYSIPAYAVPYAGKKLHSDLVLMRLSAPRSFLPSEMMQLVQLPALPVQGILLQNCGLRINENSGLLWHSLHKLSTSQGIQYYLDITGQISDKIRTEYTKTNSGYRSIPVSQELGEVLAQAYAKYKEKCAEADNRLMCSAPVSQTAKAIIQDVKRYTQILEETVPAFLRSPAVMRTQKKRRVYTLDRDEQDATLEANATCHALRRNFNTWLYCFSGLDIPEIYSQMGHEPERIARNVRSSRKTEDELRRMCLMKYVSGTDIYPSHPLWYAADGDYCEMEVPACGLDLALAPGASIELTVEDTEPGNRISLHHEGLLSELLHQDTCHHPDVSFALLPSRKNQNILSVSHPFAADSNQENDSSFSESEEPMGNA